MSDFLVVRDLGDRLGAVVGAAAAAKADRGYGAGLLDGRQIGLFFEKPSTRTRVSAEVAIRRLGGDPIVLTSEGVGLGTREPVVDVARVLDRMLDGVAFRVFEHRTLETLARHSEGPVINLLSDLEHPCQALADLATIAEHRPVGDATVAYVGDGNNVAVSLAWGVASLGGRMRIASPGGYGVDPSLLPEGIELLDDPDEAVAGADVVYTDVWTSMGQEIERTERLRAFSGWGIDLARFGRAAEDAIFLHCLPAHRGEEVATEVLEHPRSRVFDQAEYRLHAFTALLAELF
jgi:ornithine carbamoyltransferase